MINITCKNNSSISTNCEIVNKICETFDIEYTTFGSGIKKVDYFLEVIDEDDEDIEFTIKSSMNIDDICEIVELICDVYEIDFSFETPDKYTTIYSLDKNVDCDEDVNNEIEIELDDFEFLSIAKMAHERDCTFNEMINEIIEDYIFEVECDK